jgi:hypothetical protein
MFAAEEHAPLSDALMVANGGVLPDNDLGVTLNTSVLYL